VTRVVEILNRRAIWASVAQPLAHPDQLLVALGDRPCPWQREQLDRTGRNLGFQQRRSDVRDRLRANVRDPPQLHPGHRTKLPDRRHSIRSSRISHPSAKHRTGRRLLVGRRPLEHCPIIADPPDRRHAQPARFIRFFRTSSLRQDARDSRESPRNWRLEADFPGHRRI